LTLSRGGQHQGRLVPGRVGDGTVLWANLGWTDSILDYPSIVSSIPGHEEPRDCPEKAISQATFQSQNTNKLGADDVSLRR
jgi:hypothetical protein